LLVVVFGLLLVAATAAACTSRSEDKLVGKWVTTLTGYNNVAGSVTKYDQTVVFSKDGRVLLQTTLPGDTNGQKGAYEVVRSSGGQVIRITWDASPGTPLELEFEIQGDRLATTRRAGTMPKPEELNVQEVDPVVYVRQ
jgi:hypothetical protein